MEATKKNEEITRKIINIFAENELTVAESKEILIFATRKVDRFATVKRINEKLFEV